MSLFLTRDERRALRRALTLLELDRGRVVLSVVTGSLGLVSAVALSGVAAWLIARASQMPDVVALGVAPVMVRLFGISRSVLRYCERLVSHDTALRGMNALRTHVYEILASSRTDTVARLRRGDVLSRVGTDVDAVGDLVVRGFLPAGVAATVGVVTSLAMGLVYWPAGLVLAACLLLAGVLGPVATIRSARAAELARQEQATDLAATALTAIDGGSELSVAGRMLALLTGLDEVERHLATTRDKAARPAALAAAVDTLAMGLAVLGAVLVGLPAVASGSLAPVWLAVIVLVPLSAFEATANLGPASVQLVTSAGAAVRVVELLDRAETTALPTPRAAGEPAVRLQDPGSEGSRLKARGLAVGWPGGPVVAEGIDLDLGPGDRLAVVGPSGIGKTTLLLTLAGLLPPRAGELALDGVVPWSVPRDQVAQRVTLTQEDAHIFDTSVLENLRVARGSVTAEEAAGLLERAGLGPWLTTLPDGLDTVVGTDATALSGGERRRLLLARALAAPAPLMLLDEPAEHLDTGTADQLVEDLLTADASRGVLLVTHRLSALASAQEVLVLGSQAGEPARVRARGTHAELSEQDPAYRWSLEQEMSPRA
ncbi:thiol reductant ABC exporter subunit CydC [Actinomyces faecalis]|uniref:thiol reductant ABC exporter subunit CydC n=1 Tax=Actinomyces faecalis TaxID=2722820 RepID=UPI001553BA9D|nr:thiol reductant ABC exporter subunit CydC [Actinomyces faecalis]